MVWLLELPKRTEFVPMFLKALTEIKKREFGNFFIVVVLVMGVPLTS